MIYDRVKPQSSTENPSRVPISDLLNPIFVLTYLPTTSLLSFGIRGTSYRVSLSMLETLDIDSDSAFLTGTMIIKAQKLLSDADKQAFEVSKREEIDFLLKEVVNTIQLDQVPEKCGTPRAEMDPGPQDIFRR